MHADDDELRALVREVLSSQRTGVLLTQAPDGPHGSVVAFLADEDLGRLVFVTPRRTSKLANIERHSRIALMVDTRRGTRDDFEDAVAIEAIGDAFEIEAAERDGLLSRYLDRHPDLQTFARSADIAVVAIHVSRFVVVRKLRIVQELRLDASTGARPDRGPR
jgi:hypothetical protein